MGAMGEPPEDLLDVGADPLRRPDGWNRLLRYWRAHRFVKLAASVVVAAVVLTVLVAQNRHNSAHRSSSPTTPTPSVTGTPSTSPISPGPKFQVNNEYLIAIPAQDMRAALSRCGRNCVASSIVGRELTDAVRSFDGLQPLAGGAVTRNGALELQTVEGYAGLYAIAHLTVRHVQTTSARRAPTIHTNAGAGYLTTTVSVIRNGCDFTAVLVAHASVPEVAAAKAWATTTPLRCG